MKKLHVYEMPKTRANTVFMDFYELEEKLWLIDTLTKCMPKVGESMVDDPEFCAFMLTPDHKQWGRGKTSDGKHVKNSPWRLWCGFLEQQLRNGKKDITRPQLTYIENLMLLIGRPVKFVEDSPQKNSFHHMFTFE